MHLDPRVAEHPAVLPPRPAVDGYAALDQTHGELDDLFLAHQEQVLARDFRRAAMLLEHYRERLHLHLAQEERWLLPRLAEAAPARASRRAADHVYLAEHQRIRTLLDSICRQFALLLRPEPPALHVIALLEREAQLKRVIEHHSERERRELYPALERLTTARERAHIVARCLREWAAPPAAGGGARGLSAPRRGP